MKNTEAHPQVDGSLLIEDPAASLLFQMGNRRTFAEFDAEGGARNLLLTDAIHAGGWKVRCQFDRAESRSNISLDLSEKDPSMAFTRAKGVGRLWELKGGFSEIEVTVLSFMDEDSPVFRQRWSFLNPSATKIVGRLKVELDFHSRLHSSRRVRNILSRFLPRLPSLANPWAYVFLLHEPKGPLWTKGSVLRIGGNEELSFMASGDSRFLRVGKLDALMEIQLELLPGSRIDVDLALGPESCSGAPGLLEGQDAALADARAYATWLSSSCDSPDPLLKSLSVACLNAALSCFKEFPGDFSGFLAGPYYAFPPRLYYRDGYWTAQALLATRPDLVRRHLLSIARGVHEDGSVPSAVFSPHLFEGFRLPPGKSMDWLSDHYDGPSFFVLLVSDYVKASRDRNILLEPVPGRLPSRCLAEALALCLEYLLGLDRDGDGLIEKPYKANDWADNVNRSVWVTYDQALYAAALREGSVLLKDIDSALSGRYEALSSRCDLAFEKAVAGLDRELWDEGKGHYVDYKRPGFTEGHLSADSLLVPYFGLCDGARRARILESARVLQSRNNPAQPYGDWGVTCVWPCYSRSADLFAKSADVLRYHNGGDWPYWDGIYAAVLSAAGDPDWRYAISRWWEYGLSRGWLTPVEFYSPAWPAGGFLQGWSGFPAAVLAKRAVVRGPGGKDSPSLQ